MNIGVHLTILAAKTFLSNLTKNYQFYRKVCGESGVCHLISFIPRRDGCLQTSVGVQLFLLIYYYFGLGHVYWTFRFRGGNPPFWNLENVLLWWDGRDGRDGRSTKVSFNFLHTLWPFRRGIYILKYILKICHQHSYGFQNFMSSWGSWSKISKLEQVGDFSFFGSKSTLLKHTYMW